MRMVKAEDLSDELHQRIIKLEIEMMDLQFEMQMHRFVALVVFGWMLERFIRWIF